MCGNKLSNSATIRHFLLRLILGTPLILAGAIKLADPLAFRKILDAYGFFPHVLTIPLAVVLPPFEILCGCLLLLNVRVRAVALAVVGLMLAFSLFALVSVWSGTSHDCGCFGALRWLNWPPPAALARDLVLLACALLLYRDEIAKS